MSWGKKKISTLSKEKLMRIENIYQYLGKINKNIVHKIALMNDKDAEKEAKKIQDALEDIVNDEMNRHHFRA